VLSLDAVLARLLVVALDLALTTGPAGGAVPNFPVSVNDRLGLLGRQVEGGLVNIMWWFLGHPKGGCSVFTPSTEQPHSPAGCQGHKTRGLDEDALGGRIGRRGDRALLTTRKAVRGRGRCVHW
jgi:hypothetical protein